VRGSLALTLFLLAACTRASTSVQVDADRSATADADAGGEVVRASAEVADASVAAAAPEPPCANKPLGHLQRMEDGGCVLAAPRASPRPIVCPADASFSGDATLYRDCKGVCAFHSASARGSSPLHPMSCP
jgi:hypothetical protein